MRQRPSLPQITFLDLTSSRLSDSDVSRLLRNLPRLRHLVLDNCSLPEGHRAQHWAAFARSCMFAHGDLAFEKTMNRLLVARGGVSGELGSREREARILPRTAALRTLSLSLPPYVDAEEERLKLLAAFRRGWGEAVTTFNMTISAVRRSRVEEGTLVLRCPASSEVGDVLRENDYPGLVVVDDEEFARLGEVRDAEDCPVVCLAGSNGPNGRTKGIEHTEGCGHSIGWDIWEDAL
jgi:CBS domain-containing protein